MIFGKTILLLISTSLCSGHIGVFNFWGTNNTTVARKTTSSKISSKTPKEPLQTIANTSPGPATSIKSTLEKSNYYAEPLPDSELTKVKGCAGSSRAGQEIDETGNCTVTSKPNIPAKTNTTVNKSTITCTCTAIGSTSTTITTSTTISTTTTTEHDELETFDRKEDGDTPYESPVEVPKLTSSSKAFTPPLSEETTVTITKIQAHTVYQKPQIHTCLEMKNVKSFCDGKLITVSPTATLKKGATKYKRGSRPQGKMNYEVLERPDNYDPDPIFIRPTLVTPQMTQSFIADSDELPFMNEVVESSKEDLDYEEIKISYEHWLRLTNPRIKFATQYIQSTVTKSYTDAEITATVIAKSCLPQDLNLPFCNLASAFASLESIMNRNNRNDGSNDAFRSRDATAEFLSLVAASVNISSLPRLFDENP